MNQNNNFNPMMGQPIQQTNGLNQNVNPQQNYQQSAQPQMQQPTQNQNHSNNKKSMNGIIIVVIILLIVIAIGIFYLTTKDKKLDKTDVDNNTNQTVEKEEQNSTESNSNISGSVDSNTNTNYDENGAFLMPIEDIFTITGRGTLVTGKVSRGKIKVGDTIQIIGLDKEIKTTVVKGIEISRKSVDEATVGDDVGILLSIAREELEIGQVVAKPNSIVAAKKFEADVYVFSKEEGGRQTPFFTNYRPQFYFRTTEVTGTITLPDGVEMVMPGDNAKFSVELVKSIAMEVGTEFSIREGGRTIASGKITKVN